MQNPMTPEALRRVWEFQIGPIIEEYFLDQPDFGMTFTLEKYFTLNS